MNNVPISTDDWNALEPVRCLQMRDGLKNYTAPRRLAPATAMAEPGCRACGRVPRGKGIADTRTSSDNKTAPSGGYCCSCTKCFLFLMIKSWRAGVE